MNQERERKCRLCEALLLDNETKGVCEPTCSGAGERERMTAMSEKEMTDERLKELAHEHAERIVTNAETATQFEFMEEDDYRGTIVLNVEAGLLYFAKQLNISEAAPQPATGDDGMKERALERVSDDAVERLARFIAEKESLRCKTLDEALHHKSTWKRMLPEAREMLDAAYPETSALSELRRGPGPSVKCPKCKGTNVTLDFPLKVSNGNIGIGQCNSEQCAHRAPTSEFFPLSSAPDPMNATEILTDLMLALHHTPETGGKLSGDVKAKMKKADEFLNSLVPVLRRALGQEGKVRSAFI